MPHYTPCTSPDRRRFFRTLGIAATVASMTCVASLNAPPAHAQSAPSGPSASSSAEFPGSKTVRIVVGFAAGTGPDIAARILAKSLSEAWGGASIVVDNKPGAAGQLAANDVARAAADGHTLLLAETGMLSIAPHIYRKLPYDPAKDFVPVSQVVTSDFVLVVNPEKVAARTVQDYVQWAKTQKSVFMGTFGAGTPGHFGAYMFGEAVGVTPELVHYRSTADALGGLMGGDVSGIFASVGLAAPQVQAGKLAALGSTGIARASRLPDIPTIQEQGYASLHFNSWFGLVAPAHTPQPVIERIAADVQKALQQSQNRTRLQEAGFAPTGTTAAEFARILAEDNAAWGKVVQATGFKAD